MHQGLDSVNGSTANSKKIQQLYLQASRQQWPAEGVLDFNSEEHLNPELEEVWADLTIVFYTLEKMGLHVLNNMSAKAANKLQSDQVRLYLTMQSADEGRHVYAIEQYLSRLHKPPSYQKKLHVLGQVASLGFYRVENWLFSTLFSENFASAFLRRAKAAQIDPVGAEMCRRILVDESRHIHFLHLVLPEILERMSLLGKTYIKISQYFIMKFTTEVSQTLSSKAEKVGISRRDLLEEVFGNMEKAYAGFGVSPSFLYFPKIQNA